MWPDFLLSYPSLRKENGYHAGLDKKGNLGPESLDFTRFLRGGFHETPDFIG